MGNQIERTLVNYENKIKALEEKLKVANEALLATNYHLLSQLMGLDEKILNEKVCEALEKIKGTK